METIVIVFKIGVSTMLVAIGMYSALYFGQIKRVEEQFGLKLPMGVKRVLGVLTMIPITVSFVVLTVVLLQTTKI